MHYEFEKINQVIYMSLKPKNVSAQTDPAGFLQTNETIVLKAINNTRDQLFVLLTSGNRASCEDTVPVYQLDTVKAMDRLYYYMESPVSGLKAFPSLHTYQGVYDRLSNELKKLLLDIRQWFSKYYNMQEKVPDLFKAIKSRVAFRSRREITDRLTSENIAPLLIRLACKPVELLLDQKHPLSHHQYSFCLQWMEKVSSFTNTGLSNETVMNFLISNDMADEALFHYYFAFINNELTIAAPGEWEKLLHAEKEKMRRFKKAACCQYCTDASPMPDRILKWLSTKIKEVAGNTSTAKEPMHKQALESTKIRVALPLSVFSLLAKQLHVSGVFLNMDHLQICEMIANNFAADGRKTIALSSLRNNAYKPGTAVINETRELLSNILKNIRPK